MSKMYSTEITCPECQGKSEFTIWNSVNTILNPEMKAAVMDGSAFVFKCPHCGHTATIDYSILYHQMDDLIMIQYATTEEEANAIYNMYKQMQSGSFQAFQDIPIDDYLVRIVSSQNELREKIAIFNAGLDDRIIEIYKLVIQEQYLQEHPDKKRIDVYYLQKDGENLFEIYADEKFVGSVEITESFYNELQENLQGVLSDIRKDELFIDHQWAYDFMRQFSQ